MPSLSPRSHACDCNLASQPTQENRGYGYLMMNRTIFGYKPNRAAQACPGQATFFCEQTRIIRNPYTRMNTRVPLRPGERFSRREFLRRSAGATALFGLVALGSKHFLGNALAEESYTGDLVIVSQLGAAPDKALPKLLDAFKAANPGTNPKLVLYPEEK